MRALGSMLLFGFLLSLTGRYLYLKLIFKKIYLILKIIYLLLICSFLFSFLLLNLIGICKVLNLKCRRL